MSHLRLLGLLVMAACAMPEATDPAVDDGTDASDADRSAACGWKLSSVDSKGYVGSSSAVAVERDGGVHVSYLDYDNWAIKHAYRSPSGAWTKETVDTLRTRFDGSAIGVDDAGGVHIAYVGDDGGDRVRYAYRPRGGAFTATWIDPVLPASWYAGVALAVDAGGGVHLAASSAGLRYAHQGVPGAGWTVEVVDGQATGMTAIAVDATGGVHLAALRTIAYGTTDVVYANRPAGGSWTVERVARGSNPSLRLAADGTPHLTYSDDSAGQIVHAARGQDGAWSAEAVATAKGGANDPASSLAIDGAGGLHVAYDTMVGAVDDWEDIVYAYKPAGGAWTSQVVATHTFGGRFAVALGVDAAGARSLSYFDYGNANLKVARLVQPCR